MPTGRFTRTPRTSRSGRPGPAAAGVGLPAPESMLETPRSLQIAGQLCRTLVVTGYPRHVTGGWLDPLLTAPCRLDLAVHLTPIPAGVAAGRLRRQQARLESARSLAHTHGQLADPALDVAAEDATELAHALARGQQRLFTAGIYLTVWADTADELDTNCAMLTARARGLLLDVTVAVFGQAAGWAATRPHAADPLAVSRVMDTAALAASYPFPATGLGADPASPTTLLYGRTPAGVLLWDRFGLDNHNAVILARSGAGKSYLAKLEALRALHTGTQVLVVDPEDEYAPLAQAVGGTHLALGEPGGCLNPLELPTPAADATSSSGGGGEALTGRALFTHTLLDLLLRRTLTAAERAAVDQAILAAYTGRGISTDPRTHPRPAPHLVEVAAALAGQPGPAGPALAAELTPFTTGSFARLFTPPAAGVAPPPGAGGRGTHLLVLSLRALPEALKPAGTLLALDAIWAQVTSPVRRRRLVLVDEAWLLAGQPAGARFLLRLAKSARKYCCGLTCVTQDAGDLLDTGAGQAVVANAATQILLRQAPQALPRLAAAFDLSAAERRLLATAPRGQALLTCGTSRAGFTVTASRAEHAMITGAAAGPPAPAGGPGGWG